MTRAKFFFCILILITAFLLFFNLGKGSLWDWDEAIYASVAKEMVHDGDYLSLHMNENYWPEKPPLLIWCIALSFRVFGVNEASARLPTTLFGLATIILIYAFGRKLFDSLTGFLAGVLLITSTHFILLARMAMMDVPLVFFISLALYAFWEGQTKPWYFILSGIAIGLAVMTKSFVGFFPIPIMLGYMLFSNEFSSMKKPQFWVLLLLALVIPLPWHLYQIIRHGRSFTEFYFFYNLFVRTTSIIEGHHGSVFYYFKYTLEHFFTPWLILAGLSLAVFFWKLVRKRVTLSKPLIFLTIWGLLPFLFFSLVKTKVAGYVLPCYFPLALITANLSLENLNFSWFKKVFVFFLFITAIEIVLAQPVNFLTVDKSPEVKQIAEAIKNNKYKKIVTFNIPTNAPIFYFNSVIFEIGNIGQLDRLFLKEPEIYILCQENDFQLIQKNYEFKKHLETIAASKNGKMFFICLR